MTIRLLDGAYCQGNTGGVFISWEMVICGIQVVLASERAIDTFHFRWRFSGRSDFNEFNNMAGPSSLQHLVRRPCFGVNVRLMKCIRSPCLDPELRKVIQVTSWAGDPYMYESWGYSQYRPSIISALTIAQVNIVSGLGNGTLSRSESTLPEITHSAPP
jgi:hypothetical protein